MRELKVYIDRTPAGTPRRVMTFGYSEYETSWANAPRSFDLAPGLARSEHRHADGGTHRPVQWYFDNLLPEELLRQAISREAGIHGEDAFALLQYLGAESAGSLSPPGNPLPSAGDFRALSDEA